MDEAALGFEDLDAVTAHNPFAVNNLPAARPETPVPPWSSASRTDGRSRRQRRRRRAAVNDLWLDPTEPAG